MLVYSVPHLVSPTIIAVNDCILPLSLSLSLSPGIMFEHIACLICLYIVSPILVAPLYSGATTICSSAVTLTVSLLFPFPSLHYFKPITPLLHVTLLRYIPILFIYNNSLLLYDMSRKMQPRTVGQVHGIRGTFILLSSIAHSSLPLSLRRLYDPTRSSSAHYYHGEDCTHP